MKTRFVLMCALMGITVHGFAQEMSDQPPAELKKLEWLIGTWTGKFDWSMEGMESSVDMTWTNSWDGTFMKGVSTMDMMGMMIKETSYLAWDKGKNQYSMWTFTNFAPMPRIEHGKLEGDKVITISEPWDVGMPGGPTVSRATLIRLSANEMDFLLEFKMGDSWTKAASGRLKKK